MFHKTVLVVPQQTEESFEVVDMWNQTSHYFENLENDDKDRYIKKLTLTDGTLLPDPYNISTGWESDVLRLPDITWPDICSYLIDTPSDFTKDKLKAYKSLEAYNFFVSGHVQDVFFYNTKQSDMCFIKSSVLPSQRQGQNQILYDVWVAMHSTGWILCGNCTCMAGYGNRY